MAKVSLSEDGSADAMERRRRRAGVRGRIEQNIELVRTDTNSAAGSLRVRSSRF
ncbi:MAG: hypothetical protein Q7U60_08270 [Candidatus Methanoperedens sp.]|nr:hypothetical protein [Candidatus Methanoperedens sp.]